MPVKYLFTPLLVLSLALNAQEKSNDIAIITTTIENYFNGYVQRDSSLLYAAFDTENGAMKVPTISEDGNESVENNYFKELIPKWASREKLSPAVLENCALDILNIDVVNGKIASARISMKVDETIYIDILSLQKLNQSWKITNKIFLVASN